jgi:dethiobiotin synthetase
MPAFFITATGTDIGKTFVTAALTEYWRNAGRGVAAIKPVMSGYEDAEAAGSDAGILLRALGRTVSTDEIARIAPWRYRAPLAPDTAAAREGKSLDVDAVIGFCHDQIDKMEDILLIEGVGGIMAPLDASRTMLDWLTALNIPLVLVGGTYLGSISHALTALEVLELANLDVRALAISESLGSGVPLADTVSSLERLGKGVDIVTLPRGGDAVSGIAALAELLDA